MYDESGARDIEKIFENDKEGLEEFLVGDINLNYLLEDKTVEVNIMMAESSVRRKGVSTQVIAFLMANARFLHLGEELAKIKAIIGNDNEASIALFKKIGFVKGADIEAFNQTEYYFELESQG